MCLPCPGLGAPTCFCDVFFFAALLKIASQSYKTVSKYSYRSSEFNTI